MARVLAAASEGAVGALLDEAEAADDAEAEAEAAADEAEPETSEAERERDELKASVAKLQKQKEDLETLFEKEKGLREAADKERDELKSVVQQLMHASKQQKSNQQEAESSEGAEQAGGAEDAPPPAQEVTAEQRMEATNALRMAAMAGDIDQLKAAIDKAEKLGLEFEASTAKRRLAKLEAK